MNTVLIVTSHYSSARVLSKLIARLTAETQNKVVFVGNHLTVKRVFCEIVEFDSTRIQIYEVNDQISLAECKQLLKSFDDISLIMYGVYLSENSLENKFCQICEESVPQVLLLNDKLKVSSFFSSSKNLIIATNREIYDYAKQNYPSVPTILSGGLSYSKPHKGNFEKIRNEFRNKIKANEKLLTGLFLQASHMADYNETLRSFLDAYDACRLDKHRNLLLFRPHPCEPTIPDFIQQRLKEKPKNNILVDARIDIQEVLIACDLVVSINSQCLEEYILVSKGEKIARYRPIYLLLSEQFRKEKELRDKNWMPESILSGLADCALNNDELKELLIKPNKLDLSELTKDEHSPSESNVDPILHIETLIYK